MTGAKSINTSLKELYWLGYDHGHKGLPKTDLYARDQSRSRAYQHGYAIGEEQFKYTKKMMELQRYSLMPHLETRVVNQIRALRDQIDEWNERIRRAESLIRKLESTQD